MKIFFYSRYRTDISEDLLKWSLQAPGKLGCTWAANDAYARGIFDKFGIDIPAGNRYAGITPEDAQEDTVVISVGGDGTFLEAVRQLHGLPIPIVGLNLGRMGFLANISLENAGEALADICARRFSVRPRTMLTVEGDFGVIPDFPHALNEFTIHRHTADMIEVVTYADGYQLAVVRGDGMIVSTPTGSTAYCLSAGGPIVTPESPCFVSMAIAPHNFSIRPMVVPDTSVIEMEVRTRGREVLASLDNTSFIVGDGARFKIKKSEFSAFLIGLQNISFYDTLRERILWGIDKRDAAKTTGD